MYTFQDLLEKHIGATLDRQLALLELVGGIDRYALNLDAGELYFDAKHSFPVQVLGSESETSHSWLWVWSNPNVTLDPKLMRSAQNLRAFGQEHEIPEFREGLVDLEERSAAAMALVSSGVSGADAYYRAPYEGGAAYVLLDAPKVRTKFNDSPGHVADVFTRVLMNFEVAHRRAYLCYLKYKRYTYTEDPAQVEAASPSGEPLLARFDALGRLEAFGHKMGGGGTEWRPKLGDSNV
ncbi:MAG: hypothetical protein HS116_08980 [Planctomycetes bacterium]|nr:hypothetical protein [Planctomycetota bacterium]